MHPVARRMQRPVHRHIARRRHDPALRHLHPAAEIQRLPIVREARDRVVHDDLHLRALRPRGEQRMALALRHPELILLPPELRHQRRPQQQQQCQMRDKRRQLRPAEAIREQLHRPIRLRDVRLRNPLHPVAPRPQRIRQRRRLRVRRRRLRRIQREAVPRPLEIRRIHPPRRTPHRPPDRRRPTHRADRDRQRHQRHQRVPVGLLVQIEHAAPGVVKPGELRQRVRREAERPPLRLNVLLHLLRNIRQLRRHLRNDHPRRRKQRRNQNQPRRPAHRRQPPPNPIRRMRQPNPPQRPPRP